MVLVSAQELQELAEPQDTITTREKQARIPPMAGMATLGDLGYDGVVGMGFGKNYDNDYKPTHHNHQPQHHNQKIHHGLHPCQLVSALGIIRNRAMAPLQKHHHRRKPCTTYDLERIVDMINVLMVAVARNNHCGLDASLTLVSGATDPLGIRYKSM